MFIQSKRKKACSLENRSRDPDKTRNILYFLGFVDKVKYTSLKKKEKMKRKRDIPIKFNISLLQLFDKWEIFHQNTRTRVFLK